MIAQDDCAASQGAAGAMGSSAPRSKPRSRLGSQAPAGESAAASAAPAFKRRRPPQAATAPSEEGFCLVSALFALAEPFAFTEPTAAQLDEFLAAQAPLPVTYEGQGATRDGVALPSRYTVDRARVRLGRGRAAFERAVAAMKRWTMFAMPWLRLYPDDTPLEVGRVVAIVPWHFGFWSLNACRIVYVIAEERRFGFGYGTLPSHVESGEERFLIEWDATSDETRYEILAFSRPALALAQLAYPVTRLFQKRFAADSRRAMVAAVKSDGLAGVSA